MAAKVTLSISTEVLAMREGLWCRACSLPSGLTLVLAMTIGARTSVAVVTRCHDCGGDEIEG